MNAADTDAFKLYQRYADSFDNHALINAVIENKPMPVLSIDTSWTERIARMVNWEANNKAEVYVMGALGFHILSPAAIEANRNDKTFLVYWLLKNDNTLNAAQQSTKDILKKLMELENLPPAELALLKNQRSLNDARHDTKVLLKKLLGLKDLSPTEMARRDKYQTFLYLYGLIKKQKQQQIDEQVSNLMQRLTPRLR
ncbi:hypothetical protein PHMEG_00022443 [Phytophthora megakarya]|uniref:RxLR effector protein n=1 Tax=Phytophthora megakarya TaxID=4795 RepID=A0A225VJE1_9STRA|nr:hypothetical protein PHMEG_00022443 [Phytophthora megakarya]